MAIQAVAGILGGALSIGTSIFGANSAAAAEKRAAARARREARFDAATIRSLAPREAAQIVRKGARLKGAQKVGYAGSNLDVTSGTPLDVMAETIAESEMTALRAIQARNYEADEIVRKADAAAAIAVSNAEADQRNSILAGINEGIGMFGSAGSSFGGGGGG